jgi:hypothetical protein
MTFEQSLTGDNSIFEQEGIRDEPDISQQARQAKSTSPH